MQLEQLEQLDQEVQLAQLPQLLQLLQLLQLPQLPQLPHPPQLEQLSQLQQPTSSHSGPIWAWTCRIGCIGSTTRVHSIAALRFGVFSENPLWGSLSTTQ
ncbi:hypothetical protein AB4043_21940 [Terriglobus sp. YAF25]|uniref:hypothetical protein n=1 Tax=Terriglobus sp. YAF25 TaxID=3233080 RepID=UPI003F9C4670